MKNSINKVYSKLSKNKFDLSSVQALKEASDFLTIDNTNLQELQGAKDSNRIFMTYFSDAVYSAQKFVEDYETIEQYVDIPNVSDIDKVLNEFESNAIDLGINPTSIQDFNILIEQRAEISQYVTDVQEYIMYHEADYEAALQLSKFKI
jgi:hypothetical protein